MWGFRATRYKHGSHLQDVDLHGGLAVSSCGEGLALGGGQGGVPGDELRHDTAQCLQTQREGGHIQQYQVGDLP